MNSVVLIIDGNRINIDQNMARKLRKFARRKEKPQGILDRLKRIPAIIKNWYNLRKIKKAVTSMEDFDEALLELSNPELSEADRNQIASNLRDAIKQTAESYDKLLSARDLTNEERASLIEEQASIIKELTKKLDTALGIEIKDTLVYKEPEKEEKDIHVIDGPSITLPPKKS